MALCMTGFGDHLAHGGRPVDIRWEQECLNNHRSLSFADAKEKIDGWRTYYNEVRPHSALKWQAPAEYARWRLAEGQNAVSNESEI